MNTIQQVARQAAREAQDGYWKRDDDLDACDVMADAVSVAVLREMTKHCKGRYLLTALAAFTPAEPPQHCDECGLGMGGHMGSCSRSTLMRSLVPAEPQTPEPTPLLNHPAIDTARKRVNTLVKDLQEVGYRGPVTLKDYIEAQDALLALVAELAQPAAPVSSSARPDRQTVETTRHVLVESIAHITNLSLENVEAELWDDFDALIAAARREQADAHPAPLSETREAEAFKWAADLQRVYAGEGGWEWFHQPSGGRFDTPAQALAAYRQSQGAPK